MEDEFLFRHIVMTVATSTLQHLNTSTLSHSPDLFERPSLGLGHHAKHKQELQYHHKCEDCKYCAAAECVGEKWKHACNACRQDPVCKTSERLSVAANFIGEYFRDKHPDHSTLRKGKECNVNEQVDRHSRKTFRKESNRHQGEAD